MQNEAADALSRLGSQRKPVPPNTFLDVLHNPSVQLPTEEDLAIPDLEAQLLAALHIIPDWTVPYLAYMNRGKLPEDESFGQTDNPAVQVHGYSQWGVTPLQCLGCVPALCFP